LKSRCEAIAREQCAARLARWQRRLVPMALGAAGLVLTGAAMLVLATRRSNALLAAQLTADHRRGFKSLPPDAVTLDATVVEETLRKRYGWDLRIPPSSGADALRLVGARRGVYMDGRIPHLMYRVDGQDVSLYVLDGVARAEDQVRTFGHQARIWSRGTTTYVFVASASGDAIDRAAGYVRQEVH
jgi:hypothetical protein